MERTAAINKWATTQEGRLRSAMSATDDMDRQNDIEDLLFDARDIRKKSAELLEADQYLVSRHGKQG